MKTATFLLGATVILLILAMLFRPAVSLIGLNTVLGAEKAQEVSKHDDGDHDDHADHDDGNLVRLDSSTIKEFDIKTTEAKGGRILRRVDLSGEVVFNADRIAHVTPTVSGIVKQVRFSVGQRAEPFEVMAVLTSRELAAARAEFLASKARLELAAEIFERDERLFKEKVGTERQVLAARQGLKETQIQLNLAENVLHALGYSHEQVARTGQLDDMTFADYELTAPIGGMVTKRHLTMGEVVEPIGADSPFIIADLSSVWVNLTVYQRDLASVHAPQEVRLKFGHTIPEAVGKIAFVSPALDEATRTATARIVLANPDGYWRPGLFVTGRIIVEEQVSVRVPRSAILPLEDQQVVFVETDEGFEPRPVKLGQASNDFVEIVEGLEVGQWYVDTNAFTLKAEFMKGSFGRDGHVH